MIYDGPRDSFVANAKLALKLADTDAKLWADLAPKEHPVTWSAGQVQQISASVTWSAGDGMQSRYRRNVTFLQTPPSCVAERKPQPPATGPAARLFLRRSVHGFKKHECVACQHMAMESDSVQLPCGHFYDVSCLLSLVKVSMEDESLFPPRCCQQIVSTVTLERCMNSELSKDFASKTLEFSTLRRVYCATASCSRFLGPRNKTKGPLHAYDCPARNCSTRTCSRCRCEVKKHVLHACRPDEVPRRLLQLGQAQQCPGCDRLVELHSGCFHMTCVCKTQFCYRCGSKWKTCKCPLFEDIKQTADTQQHGYTTTPPAPLPAEDHSRQTWVLVPSPRDIQPLAKRRGRSSAPAELQGYIPARESIVLRGVQAQERRSKSKEDRRQPKSQIPSTAAIDNQRLDVLEKHVDRLLHFGVQNLPCRHDWRASPRLRESCACGRCANYSCSRCATNACITCRSRYPN